MAKPKCPRDDNVLDEGAFHEIACLHCATCDGVLIKQLSLFSLLTEMAKELSRDISFEDGMKPIPDKGANVNCPQCASRMENYGYMGGTRVYIDSCSKCSTLWIDTNELAAMCFLNERANKCIDHRKEVVREHNRQMEQLMLTYVMQNAFQRGFIMGGILF